MATEHDGVLAVAEHRYFYDPEFHAKAETVVLIVDAGLRDKTGRGLDDDDQSLVRHAAVVALSMSRWGV